MDTAIQEIEFTPAGHAVAPTVRDLVPPAPPTPTGGDPFLVMIERAASDPRVDIDKMERLFRMKLEHDASKAKTAYLQALAAMQPELPVITKHGVIGKNVKDERGQNTGKQEAMTKYARWEDVVEGITPILAEHGFSLSFRIAQPTPDRVSVSGVLGHRDGHTEETTLALPIDSSGAKNNVQGWGSSVSYGKRYTAFALLNISARGEDDDGVTGGGLSDEERLSTGPRDPETGRLLSTYDAAKNARAKDIADRIVQNINLSPNRETAKEIWAAEHVVTKGKRSSPLGWLKDNAPGQYLRCQTVYENVVGLE